jgi:hypothetical protein
MHAPFASEAPAAASLGRGCVQRVLPLRMRGLPLVFVAACLTSFAQQAEEVRQGLIGFPARDLRRCIGLPRDVDVQGDLEVQVYRWQDDVAGRDRLARREEVYDECLLPETAGRHGADQPPLLDPTEPHPNDPRRTSESYRCRRGGARGPVSIGGDEIGYCQLVLEVRGGAVTQVTAEGRASNGLNQEAQCMLRARDCLAPSAAKD